MLRNLATAYDVLDNIDGSLSKVFVIDSDDLYEVIETIPMITTKATKGIKSNPYDITWYCTDEEEFMIEDAVAQAKLDGNDTVVVEILSSGTEPESA